MFHEVGKTTAKNFDDRIYTSISLTKLTIFAINEITRKNEECAYERIVKECFTLFSKRFSFQRYPEWPDGSRIKIEILRCRDHGWVTGNEKSGFKITSLGRRVAYEVLKELTGTSTIKSVSGQTRDRGDTIIKYLEKSEPYKRFVSNKRMFTLTEGEFRKLLVATYETPPRVLKQNMNFCLETCKQYKKNEFLEFLKVCQKQYTHLLKSHQKRKKHEK